MPEAFPWLQESPHQTMLALLGHEHARFVGGCVRDSLLGETPKDFDIATTHHPEAVMRLLRQAGMRCVPSGLAYGTVTAVCKDRTTYEITTLRSDMKTYGRHADVQLGGTWETDARRRDFTMNALYLDAEGRLFDFTDGLSDLRSRCVRFIGEPAIRLQEDYLRFLRFFRFHVRFGDETFHKESLQACLAHKAQLASLSAERMYDECVQLLNNKGLHGKSRDLWMTLWDKEDVWSILAGYGAPQNNLWPTLVKLESMMDQDTSFRIPWIVLLWGCVGSDGALTIPRFLLKRHDKKLWCTLGVCERVQKTLGANAAFLRKALRCALRLLAFQTKQHFCGPWAWILVAREVAQGRWTCETGAHLLQSVLQAPPDMQALPVKGPDLKHLGIKPGAAMGRVLSELEEMWIVADYKLSQCYLLQQADKLHKEGL